MIGTEDGPVHKPLAGLHDDGGEPPSPFDFREVGRTHPAPEQRRGEDLRGRHGVLDGEVDADPAGRGHRMRGVADAEQAVDVPGLQPVQPDVEPVQVIEGPDGIHPVGEVRAKPGDPASEAFDALRADPGVGAFRCEVAHLVVVVPGQGHQRLPRTERRHQPGHLATLRRRYRGSRNHQVSNGTGNSFGASPAAARSTEWRPSVATTRSARSSSWVPSGARNRTPRTRPPSRTSPVAVWLISSVNPGSSAAAAARKFRKSHCGIMAT